MTSEASPTPAPAAQPKRFGAFAGVFTPTLLTILGVIMYLRLGWVVGHGGLIGGGLVVLFALAITTATGLSLSSIATNTRLGAGGPYAIIAHSLGLEVGGSIGVPLYLSQALAVTMYIFGFREGWAWIFPSHPALLVDLATFVVVFVIAYLSATLAFRIQYVVMVVIFGSLVSIAASPALFRGGGEPIVLWAGFGASEDGVGFWQVFAVFFPAATGIMAGANMSGELANPRKSIPRGTLAAIAVSSVVYVALVFWSARVATIAELRGNYMIMVDRAAFPPIVLAGLLGATFSSALSSMVGAPRIAQALGRDRLIPFGPWFAHQSSTGEPRRGMVLTGGIVLLTLMLRDLNVIAPLVTMFFLIAYAVVNLVVLVEARLGLTSFRPTLRLPRIVPLAGAVGCVFAMFIVNPTFSLVAVGVVIALYFYSTWQVSRLPRRDVTDARSSIFVAFAEWAAARVIQLGMTSARAWKPNILVPVEDTAALRGEFQLLRDFCRPEGSIKLLGITTTAEREEISARIRATGLELREQQVFTTWSVLDRSGFEEGIVVGLQALGSAFFRPNMVFARLPEEPSRIEELRRVVVEARRQGVAVLLLGMHDKAGLGRRHVINLWVRAHKHKRLKSAEDAVREDESNLAILAAYRLQKAWRAKLNIIAVIEEGESEAGARAYVDDVVDLCRLPRETETVILTGTLEEVGRRAPQADLDIVGLVPSDALDVVREMVLSTQSSCLFTVDSGNESALV